MTSFYDKKVSLGYITARGLAELPIDDELYRQREIEKSSLRKARTKLQANCANAEVQCIALDSEYISTDDPIVEVDTVLTEAEATFPEKAKALYQSARKLSAFQQRHGLYDDPISPPIIQNFFFLLFIIVIESIVNAGFFLEAHLSAGPVAALSLSLLVSLTNVSVSTYAGYLGRWKNYGCHAPDANTRTFRFIRLKAQLFFWFYLLLMVLFHTTVGFVRTYETLESVLSFHNLEGYLTLITTPHGLFLVMIGATMSAISYGKGKTSFSDPYPGYGRMYNATLVDHDEILDPYEDFSEEIEGRFDDAENTSLKSRKRFLKKVTRYHRAIQKCLKAHRTLLQSVDRAESSMKEKITCIAGQHRAARGDNTKLSPTDLGHLSSFQSYLEDIELPAFYHIPDERDAKERREADRSRALKQLSTLLEETLNPKT